MTQTSAQRRVRGLRRLEVWLTAETLEQLDAICEESGCTRADVIRRYVQQETEENAALRAKTRRRRR